MLTIIPDVLDHQTLRDIRERLDRADWRDGRETAGGMASGQKNNRQLLATDPVAVEIGQRILDCIARNPLFVSATLPLRILPPMFNSHALNEEYGFHVDNAVRYAPASGERMRADISATLFLSHPEEYEGGELIINDTFGAQSVKLPAGHLVIYPGTSLHRVAPVTRGRRTASFFWIQSMVKDDGQRAILFELDTAIQRLAASAAEQPEIVRLSGVYHNLIRQWSEI